MYVRDGTITESSARRKLLRSGAIAAGGLEIPPRDGLGGSSKPSSHHVSTVSEDARVASTVRFHGRWHPGDAIFDQKPLLREEREGRLLYMHKWR